MLLYAFAPGVFGGRLEAAGDFFRLPGVGLLVVVAGPVALALVALTIVGIPLALLVVAIHIPFLGGLVWVIALLTGMGLFADRARTAWVSIHRVPVGTPRSDRALGSDVL